MPIIRLKSTLADLLLRTLHVRCYGIKLKPGEKKADVRGLVRFKTPVRNVYYDESTELFIVTVHDIANNNTYREVFDYVVVTSGNFSKAKVPEFNGFSTYSGRILHAHDFCEALEFKKKGILMIGTSYSAEDIGSQCYKYGVKSITIKYRINPMGFNWPDNWKESPYWKGLKVRLLISLMEVQKMLMQLSYVPVISITFRFYLMNCVWKQITVYGR